jgi:hypothetical protein
MVSEGGDDESMGFMLKFNLLAMFNFDFLVCMIYRCADESDFHPPYCLTSVKDEPESASKVAPVRRNA